MTIQRTTNHQPKTKNPKGGNNMTTTNKKQKEITLYITETLQELQTITQQQLSYGSATKETIALNLDIIKRTLEKEEKLLTLIAEIKDLAEAYQKLYKNYKQKELKKQLLKQINIKLDKVKATSSLKIFKHIKFIKWNNAIENNNHEINKELIRQTYLHRIYYYKLDHETTKFNTIKIVINPEDKVKETQSSVKLKFNYYGVDLHQRTIKTILGMETKALKPLIVHFTTPQLETVTTEKIINKTELEIQINLIKAKHERNVQKYKALDGRTKEAKAQKEKLKIEIEKFQKLEQRLKAEKNKYKWDYKNPKYNTIILDVFNYTLGQGHAHSPILTDQDKIDEYMEALQKYTNLPTSSAINLNQKKGIQWKNKDKFTIREADYKTYQYLLEHNALELRPDVDQIEHKLRNLKIRIAKLYQIGKKEEALKLFQKYEALESQTSKEYAHESQVGYNDILNEDTSQDTEQDAMDNVELIPDMDSLLG